MPHEGAHNHRAGLGNWEIGAGIFARLTIAARAGRTDDDIEDRTPAQTTRDLSAADRTPLGLLTSECACQGKSSLPRHLAPGRGAIVAGITGTH